MTTLATRQMLYRVLNQYSQGDKWNNTISEVGALFDETDAVLYEMLFGRFLDTAVGVHLDRVGGFIGLKRGYAQQTEGILTWYDASGPYVGAETWGYGVWTSSKGLFTDEKWSDDEYKHRIRVRAKSRGLGGSIPEIYTWITESFGVGCVITVPEPMKINIELSGIYTALDVWLIENESPALPGVEVFVSE